MAARERSFSRIIVIFTTLKSASQNYSFMFGFMPWFTLCRLYWVWEITWRRIFYLLCHIMLKWYIRSGETQVGSMHINCIPATWNSILEWTILLLISESTADINLLTFWTQEGQRLRVCPERLLCAEPTDNMFISERKWSTAESRKSTTGVGHWLQKKSQEEHCWRDTKGCL